MLRVVDAIAGHRNDVCALERLDDPHLVLGRDPSEHTELVDLFAEFLDVEVVELAPGDGAAGDTEVGCDGSGRGGVVAGDHLHLDPGVVAPGDGLGGFGTCRVEDPDEGLEAQILDQAEELVLEGILDRAGVDDRTAGDRENPQTPCREGLDAGFEVAAASIVHGLRLAGSVGGPGAPVEQRLGCALDADLQATRGIRYAMERRHEPVCRVERDLGDPRASTALDIGVDSGLGCEHDEGGLGRIAHDLAVVGQRAVVAHHRCHQRGS